MIKSFLFIFISLVTCTSMYSHSSAMTPTEENKPMVTVRHKISNPNFALPDAVHGKIVTLSGLKSDIATVIVFMCNHCPYVLHILDKLVVVASEYDAKGVKFIGISSNDAINYPDDAPDKMKELAERLKFPFPYLYDKTQEVAKAYEAVCTPDIFVLNNTLQCIYRGQFDDSRPDNGTPVTGKDLRIVLDAALMKKPIPQDQNPSRGCSIKWIES